jgi:hypothetical protein
MGRTACAELQCLYKGALYFYFYLKISIDFYSKIHSEFVFVMQKLYVLCKETEFFGITNDFLASKCHVLVHTNSAFTGYGFNDQALISVCGRDFVLTATVCSRWLWDSLKPH